MTKQVELTEKQQPLFYDCGICGYMHHIEWDGDCRQDNARFTIEDLDAQFGAFGWHEEPMPGSSDEDEDEE